MTQATKTTLPDFEGQPVVGAALKVINAGDGLSAALELGPKVWHNGDEICLVLKAKVTQVNHKSASAKDEDEDLIRVHTASTIEVTEVEEAQIEAFLASARTKLREAEEAKTGQTSMVDGKDEPKVKPTIQRGHLSLETDDAPGE